MNYYNPGFYPTTQNGFAYVNGVEDAKTFIVSPNSTYFLRDTNSNLCFEKRADANGKWTMKVYNLVEVQPDEPVKKSELVALENKIAELTALIKGGVSND